MKNPRELADSVGRERRLWRLATILLYALIVPVLGATSDARAFQLPIGPGNESVIQGLTAPMPSSGPLGPSLGTLESIQIGGWDIRFVVKSPAGSPTATTEVTVAFDKTTGAPTVSVDAPQVPGARELAQAIESNLKNLTIGPVAVRAQKPRGDPGVIAPPQPTMIAPPLVFSGRLTDAMKRSQWFSIALLLLYIGGLWFGRRALGDAFKRAWSSGGPAAAIVVGAGWLLCWLLPDTVLYHDGNGWGLANSISVGGDFHHGALAQIIPQVLGVLGPEGWEASVASRVAYCLVLPVIWLWSLTLFGDRFVALAVLGLFATQPGFLYMSGAPFVATSGLLVVCLAGWHSCLAMREANPRLLWAAVGALALAANFRVIGPFMGPGLALIACSITPVRPLPPRFWKYAAIGAVAVVVLAMPRLVGIATLQGEHKMNLPGTYQLVESVFGSQHWAPGLLFWMATAGLVVAWLPSGAATGLPTPNDSHQAPTTPLRRLWWTLGIVAAVLIPLAAGVMAVDNWINVLRYQGWAMLGCILAAGPLFLWLRRAPGPKWAATAAAGLLVGAYGMSVFVPAHAYAFEHPEQAQLRAWKSLAQTLPPDARLAIPAHRGFHAPHLPTVALMAARPDITIMAVAPEHGRFEADYWFEPLLCGMPFFDAPGNDSCEVSAAAIDDGRFRAVDVVAATLERVALYEAAGSWPMRATERYWMSPPLRFQPLHYLGLYRIVAP